MWLNSAIDRKRCFNMTTVVALLKTRLDDGGWRSRISRVVAYANHPFHLHGHVFAVLGMDRLGDYTSLQAVKDLDKLGKLRRNFDNPPLKDTVTVPDGGYTVVRFRANNPGYWFLHCHLSFHVEIGMGLIVHVGEKSDLPPVPEGFPKCKPYKSYTPNPVENLQAEIDKSNRQNNTPKRN